MDLYCQMEGKIGLAVGVAFDIIEQEFARLEEVDGIGPKRRQRIKEAWAEPNAGVVGLEEDGAAAVNLRALASDGLHIGFARFNIGTDS